jgi:hypothetical protein
VRGRPPEAELRYAPPASACKPRRATPAIHEGCTRSLRISHTGRRAPLQLASKTQVPCTPYRPPNIAGVTQCVTLAGRGGCVSHTPPCKVPHAVRVRCVESYREGGSLTVVVGCNDGTITMYQLLFSTVHGLYQVSQSRPTLIGAAHRIVELPTVGSYQYIVPVRSVPTHKGIYNA